MISNKNHITRQKNIELIGISDDSAPTVVISNNNEHTDVDSRSPSIYLKSNHTSATNSNSNLPSLEEKSPNEEESKLSFRHEPENSSYSSDNSAGCLNDDNVTLDLYTALNEIQPSKEIHITHTAKKTSKTTSSNGRLQIPSALRQRLLRSKSPRPANPKKLLSTHSNPGK